MKKLINFKDYHNILINENNSKSNINNIIKMLEEYLEDLNVLKGDISYKTKYNVYDNYEPVSYITSTDSDIKLEIDIDIVMNMIKGDDFNSRNVINNIKNLAKLTNEVETIFNSLNREDILKSYHISLETDTFINLEKDYIFYIKLENKEKLSKQDIESINDNYYKKIINLLKIEQEKLDDGWYFEYNEDELSEDTIMIGLFDEEGLIDSVGKYSVDDDEVYIDWDEVNRIILKYSE